MNERDNSMDQHAQRWVTEAEVCVCPTPHVQHRAFIWADGGHRIQRPVVTPEPPKGRTSE